MAKRIYFYINDDDLNKLLVFLTENNLYYSTDDDIRAIDISDHLVKIRYDSLFENDSQYIKFVTSSGFPDFIFEAYILLNDESECDEKLKKAFLTIKKYIQTHYKLSKTKEYYYAPGIYQDWLDKKVQFPVLLDFDEYVVDVDNFNLKSFIDDITDRGYIVRVAFAKLEVMDEIDLNAESMVIYTSDSKLCTTIIDRKIIRYEMGSECIFLYRIKRKKRHVYKFWLDKRITEATSYKLIELFKELTQTNY